MTSKAVWGTVFVLIASSVLSGMTISFARSGPPFAALSASGGGWTNMFPAARPTFFFFTHLAYDVKSDRTVVFGGNSIDVQETWSYDLDNNTWTNMAPADRPPGANSPLVYDSESDRFIHFGGLVWCENRECVTRSDETWAYDLESNTWTNMNPTSKPPRSFGGHAMAYDSRSDRIIWYSLFLNDPETWAYDFNTNTWTNMNPTLSPWQGDSAMAYDSQSDRMILFGADGNQTWAYDFDHNQWTELTPSDSPSLFEGGLAMAYDSESDRVILLGYAQQVDAQGVVRFYPETWAYDFDANTWTNMPPVAGPWDVGRLAYDSQSDRVILFGGFATFGYPWAYDFNANAWRDLHPNWPLFGGLTAYDSQSDRTVLVAVNFTDAATETWSYDFDANTWTNMRPPSTPPPRGEASIAYDSQSDRIVLFGGTWFGASGVVQSDETWTYDLKANTWKNMNPVIRPSARNGQAMTYDSESDRIILFGGGNNETWAYDFDSNAWTNMSPAVAPSSKFWYGMAYDSQSDRVVLFGGDGLDESGTLVASNETWTYDLNTNNWTKMRSATKPSPRAYPRMAYDSRSDRIILFGGLGGWTDTGPTLFEDTWSYDVDADRWTNLSAAFGPRIGCIDCDGMAYDSQSDRVILYFSNGDGQTWAYDFGAQAGPPITPPWVVYATVAVAGAAVAAVVSVLVWRRQRRSRLPPAPRLGGGP